MDLSKIVIGKYINANSVIHRLNPLSKFTAFILILTLIFWSHIGFEQFFYLCIVVVLLFAISKISIRTLISQWRIIIFLMLVLFFIAAIFSFNTDATTGTVGTDHIGKWHFSKQILPNTLFITGRIFLIMNLAAFLTSTSTSSEITTAILYLLSPLRIIKLPVEEIALMISIALRFIPTFISEADIIIKAQASRGLDIQTKNPRKKVVALLALIIPLFLSAFSKAEDLSSAMDSRGYIVGASRTRKEKFALSVSDGVFIITIAYFFIFMIVSIHFLNTSQHVSRSAWFHSFWNWWGWRQPII